MTRAEVFWNVLVALFVFAAMLFITFITVFMVLFSGALHYVPLIIVLAVIIYITYVLKLFNVLKKPKMVKYTSIAAGIAILIALIQPVRYAIDSRIKTVDAEVDIYQYEPFVEGNQLVKLPSKASLQMTEPLPKMDGATALYPLYAAIAQAVYPVKEYSPYNSEVMVNTTPDAYQNLLDGKVDLIFVAAPSTQQLQRAEAKGVEFILTPIGKEAFVFFVNAKNQVNNLTLEQIKRIYAGQLTNWSEVGGSNDKIRAFQRPQDSGSQTALQRLMGDTPIMEAPREDVATGMGGIIEQVSNYKNYKNAIGYTFRYYSNEMVRNEEIKLLQINSVAPTKETIRADTYPITSEFFIVTTNKSAANTQQLIEWILSNEGQNLVEEAGYVPVHLID